MTKKNLLTENSGPEAEPESGKKRTNSKKHVRSSENSANGITKLKGKPNYSKIRTITTRHNTRIRLQLSTMFAQPNVKLKSNISSLNEKTCFNCEEVTGVTVEYPIMVCQSAEASNILPGAVFSANDILERGKFVYHGMRQRKALTLKTVGSDGLKYTSEEVVPTVKEDFRQQLTSAAARLTDFSNCISSKPYVMADSQSAETTIEDFLTFKMAPSRFFIDESGAPSLNLTSPKKNYYYLFTFRQKFMTVSAGKLNGPDDIFTYPTERQPDWFYFEEVEYGRLLHIIFESNIRLDNFCKTANGALNWHKFNSGIAAEPSDSNLIKQISVKVHAGGGVPNPETDPKKIKAAVDDYFTEPVSEFQIVPLSFKATDMEGNRLSLKTEAFLKQKNCLRTNKLRVGIKSISVLQSDASENSYGQLFGSLSIYVYNDRHKVILADGREMPAYLESLNPPTTKIRYGAGEHPLRLKAGTTLNRTNPILNNKYVNLTVENLHYRIKIYATGREEENLPSRDWKQTDEFDKTVGQILHEGILEKTLFFNEGNSQVELTIDINPY